jgi:methionyl-tRNA formyltransferase
VVGTTTDPLELVRVHPAGKKAMSAADWWRGRQPEASPNVDETDADEETAR